MITSNSRYVTGLLVPQDDDTVTVRRVFPDPLPPTEEFHTWKQSDRLDRLAAEKLGHPRLWWKIMDANPMIQNPSDIRPGQQIRIPARG